MACVGRGIIGFGIYYPLPSPGFSRSHHDFNEWQLRDRKSQRLDNLYSKWWLCYCDYQLPMVLPERFLSLPKHGSYFALLKTDGSGSYTTLSQSFYASAGDKICGWAFFKAEDYMPYNDSCAVYIKRGGTLIYTAFSAGARLWATMVVHHGLTGNTPSLRQTRTPSKLASPIIAMTHMIA